MQDKKRGLYKVNAPTETCNYKPFACKTILPLFLRRVHGFSPSIKIPTKHFSRIIHIFENYFFHPYPTPHIRNTHPVKHEACHINMQMANSWARDPFWEGTTNSLPSCMVYAIIEPRVLALCLQ